MTEQKREENSEEGEAVSIEGREMRCLLKVKE